MRDQVQQTGITLQIGTQVHLPVDDLIQIIDRVFIIAAAKIQSRRFVIEDQDPVTIQIDFILLQLFLDIRHKCQPFGKTAIYKMLVDLGNMQVNKSLDPVVVVFLNGIRMKKLSKRPQVSSNFG